MSFFENKVGKTVLLGIFLVLFSFISYLIYQSITLHYHPIFSDEYAYYLDSKSFWLYDRISAATTLNENFSKIAQAGFHGFSYTIFYGMLFKLIAFFGMTPSIMLANIFLAAVALLFLLFIHIALEKKLLIGILFLSNFILIVFLPSGMTEILHYVSAFLLAYLLYLIYNKQGDRRYIYTFVLLVLVLAFFRQSWIFALFGLYPLGNSIKDFIKYTLIILMGLFLVLLDIKLFHAPYPFGFFQQLSVNLQSGPLSDSLALIYGHFLHNLDNYFLSETYEDAKFVFYFKYLFVALLLYGFFCSFITRQRVILAATLIATVIFFTLLLLYDTYDWREVRMLMSPFIILVVIFILQQRYIPVIIVILFQLFTLASVWNAQKQTNVRRAEMNALIEEYKPVLNDFIELKKYLGNIKKKNVLILLNQKLFSLDYSPLFYQIPLSLEGKYIHFSFIFGSWFDIKHSKCDIFISDKMENIPNMKLLGYNKNYYFYRNTNIEQ